MNAARSGYRFLAATLFAALTTSSPSTNFPTQSPYQATNQGGYDTFVTKLSVPSATAVPALSTWDLAALAVLLLALGALRIRTAAARA